MEMDVKWRGKEEREKSIGKRILAPSHVGSIARVWLTVKKVNNQSHVAMMFITRTSDYLYFWNMYTPQQHNNSGSELRTLEQGKEAISKRNQQSHKQKIYTGNNILISRTQHTWWFVLEDDIQCFKHREAARICYENWFRTFFFPFFVLNLRFFLHWCEFFPSSPSIPGLRWCLQRKLCLIIAFEFWMGFTSLWFFAVQTSHTQKKAWWWWRRRKYSEEKKAQKRWKGEFWLLRMKAQKRE